MTTDPRQTLIAAATHFYQQGWMVGTAGNLSLRLPDQSFWITASGCNKGQLTINDFIRVEVGGSVLEKPHPDVRPSAETSIHQAIYSCFPEAQACYHVHSIEANLVSHLTSTQELALPAIEMLKGLGIWEEKPAVSMPVFDNHLQVPKIAEDIQKYFAKTSPKVPALLIRSHGVTVWGSSATAAYNYIELVEYIFRYLLKAYQLNISVI